MVVGQQLCPFARVPFEQNLICYKVVDSTDIETQLLEFWKTIEEVENTPSNIISNALVIFPNGLNDFYDFLDLFDLSEKLIVDQNKNQVFQMASFHPQYQFEDAAKNDVTNYTNRSPHPMMHILRIKEVAGAIASHPNIDDVPEENKKRLKELGLEGIEKIIDEIK